MPTALTWYVAMVEKIGGQSYVHSQLNTRQEFSRTITCLFSETYWITSTADFTIRDIKKVRFSGHSEEDNDFYIWQPKQICKKMFSIKKCKMRIKGKFKVFK